MNYMNKESYKKYSKLHSKPSPILLNCFNAFLIGGGICFFGEILFNLFKSFDLDETKSRTLVSVSLIFLTCLLSGIGIFDKIAKHAGAGTFVPITGFANAVVSPAIDYKAEGYVLGLAAKMFIIAGPVIVYGVSASVIYGIIYWVTTLF